MRHTILLTAALAAAAVTTSAAWVPESALTFTILPDNPAVMGISFTAGVGPGATDAFDNQTDALEPPAPPGPAMAMHTLGVPGALGAVHDDYRSSAPGSAAWGNGVDLLCIDGYNLSQLGFSGYETAVLTWDLSAADGYAYFLEVVDTGELLDLQVETEYAFQVSRRYGIGPSFVLTGELVPEPGTLLLLGAGLTALAAARARE